MERAAAANKGKAFAALDPIAGGGTQKMGGDRWRSGTVSGKETIGSGRPVEDRQAGTKKVCRKQSVREK